MLSENISDEYINIVKRHLKISWYDYNTEMQIVDIMRDAELTLNRKLGAEIDYLSAPGFERRLYLAYCLYLWNNAESEFDNNYQNDILELRAKYATESEAEDDTDQ